MSGHDVILTFDPTHAKLSNAGGKGMNLAELSRAGFPIPPGFVVTTHTYRAFVEANALQPRILDIAQQVRPDQPQSLEEASARIHALFEGGSMPAYIADAISGQVSALTHNTDMPLAVRSSATAEDLPGMSFAGQQDTFLNVIGVQQVLQAVKHCWASLWTARAISYRARNQIPPDQVALAVVVQQMIPSQSSGVLFTANPLTGNRDEMVIDASFGLGEAIVAGKVEPDHFVVDARSSQIKSRKLGAKALAVVPRAGGGTDEVAQEGAAQPALSDADVVALAQMAQRVAEHFGSPQDIEWAMAGGKLHLLQSRPVTSLYPLPARAQSARPEDLRFYFSFNSLQGIPEPISPLGINTIQAAISGLFRFLGVQGAADQFFVPAGSRLFVDATAALRDPHLRKAAFALLSRGDPIAYSIGQHLLAEGRIQTVESFAPRRRLALIKRVSPAIATALRALAHPRQTCERVTAEVEQFVTQAQGRAASAMTLAELLDYLQRDAGAMFVFIGPRFVPVVAAGFALMSRIDGWLSDWLGLPSGAALPLLRGLPHNVTTQMDLALWSAAQHIRDDASSRAFVESCAPDAMAEAYRHQAMPAIAQDALSQFLDKYGHRGHGELDIGRPRWRDDPTPLLQALKAYLSLSEADAPDAAFARGAEEAHRYADDLVARVRQAKGTLRARQLRWAIDRLRSLAGLRESPKFNMIVVFDAYRQRLLQFGAELAARGALRAAMDIFLVPLASLMAYARGEAIDIDHIAEGERAAMAHESTRRLLPHVLLSNGETYYERINTTPSDANTLFGEAVSPGVTEGNVRVMFDPSSETLLPGEILVCPGTDPGWTPLFLAAGGLITEVGGMVTHGSVVAREYGIPAVVGVPHATTRLKTGQRVRVDGGSGRVVMLGSDQ